MTRQASLVAFLLAATLLAAAPVQAADKNPLNVVVLTGGHGYDTKKFPNLFAGYDDLKFTFVTLKNDSEIFEDISDWKYDVIVMYSMTQKISEKRQANFIKLMEKGIGVVSLHHNVGAFQAWPEFAKIIGCKFLLKDGEIDGTKMKTSTWQDDVDFKVHVEDADHPVTRGVKDFEVRDESYKGQWHDPAARVLLTTDQPLNDKPLAWVKTYLKSRTCCIQLGHGGDIYSNANYRMLVANAIRWTAGDSGK